MANGLWYIIVMYLAGLTDLAAVCMSAFITAITQQQKRFVLPSMTNLAELHTRGMNSSLYISQVREMVSIFLSRVL